MTQDKICGKLVAFRVPWQIEQCATGFTTRFAEGEDFVVGFESTWPSELLETRRIEISFRSTAQIVHKAVIGKSDASISWLDYDCGDVVYPESVGGREDYYQLWRETEICPNPFAFQVENSRELRGASLEEFECREFLLVGSDWSISILAKEFVWLVV